MELLPFLAKDGRSLLACCCSSLLILQPLLHGSKLHLQLLPRTLRLLLQQPPLQPPLLACCCSSLLILQPLLNGSTLLLKALLTGLSLLQLQMGILHHGMEPVLLLIKDGHSLLACCCSSLLSLQLLRAVTRR